MPSPIPVFVHFGDASHLPMFTRSYRSERKARAEVKRSLAEGWPARLQEAPDSPAAMSRSGVAQD